MDGSLRGTWGLYMLQGSRLLLICHTPYLPDPFNPPYASRPTYASGWLAKVHDLIRMLVGRWAHFMQGYVINIQPMHPLGTSMNALSIVGLRRLNWDTMWILWRLEVDIIHGGTSLFTMST